MRARPSRSVAAVFALAVAATTTGCNKLFNPEGCNEPVATILPLEPVMLSTTELPWPDLATTTTRDTLSVNHKAAFGGHYECEARGYVHVPIRQVWDVLAYPPTTYLLNQDGHTTNLDVPCEPIADPESVSSVAFWVFYKSDTHNSIVPVVKFDVQTRMGWIQGSMEDPLELGLRSHKTCGTTHIQQMDGSIVARPVPPEDLPPGVAAATAIEMIFFLEADTQGQDDCDNTLRNRWERAPGDDPVGIKYWLERGPGSNPCHP